MSTPGDGASTTARARAWERAIEAADPFAQIEALGALVLRGEPPLRVRARFHEAPTVEALASIAAGSRAWEALESLAVELCAALDEGSIDEALRDEGALVALWSRASALREQVERVRAGLQLYGLGDAALDEGAVAAVLSFDALLRPQLWRALSLRERADALSSAGSGGRDDDEPVWARVHRSHRAACWWAFEGREVDPSAVRSLGAVAVLIARFPQAERALYELVAARNAWAASGAAARAPTASAAGAVLRSLASWAQSRGRGAPSAGFALAAADALEGEVTVRCDETFECSLQGPRTLVVDLLCERADGAAVTLEREGAAETVRVGTAVVGSVERFAFALSDEDLAWPEGLRVRVRVRGGDERSLRVPGDTGS